MNKILIYIYLIILNANLYSQKITISGFIYDTNSHERLIGATVYDNESHITLTSNQEGFYSVMVHKEKVSLRCSYVGYFPDTINLNLKKDTILTIFLKSSNELAEVTIAGESNPLSYNAVKIETRQLAKLPVMGGEPDILKSMQLIPGVQSTSEGQAGFSVKGGEDYQNLVLLDGVPVYNPYHMFGFFSIFNEKAIQDITIYKGDFPARYGGRLSSVLDIQTREGNSSRYCGSASVGLLAASANVEGPINNKTTFFISGRQSYLNLLASPLIQYFSGYNTASYGFYDLNAKITHSFSNRDKLILSVYRSHDSGNTTDSEESFYFNEQDGVTWGNLLGSLKWNHIINSKLFLNTISHYSSYNYTSSSYYGQYDNSEYENTQTNYQSQIFDAGINTNLTWFQSTGCTWLTGAEYIHQTYIPGVTSSFNTNINSIGQPEQTENETGNLKSNSNQFDLYVQGDFRFLKKLELHTGLRYTMYKDIAIYNNIEPRFNLEYTFKKIKAGFSYTLANQYNHLLTTTQINEATDLWVPSTTGVPPEQSVQYSLNFERPVTGNYLARVELYYKTFSNLLAYQDGASYLNSSSWQDIVTEGVGYSRGITLTLEKKYGNTTGWITYTLSKTERRFDLINNGGSFPFDYDHRHDLKIVLLHHFSSRFDAGCNWIYHTGNYISFGNQMDPGQYIYVTRNSYELPVYHRLDIDLNYHIKKTNWEHIITLSIYNAYNHKNIYSIQYVYNEGFQNLPAYFIMEKSLFPVIPSLTYRINFH